MREYTCLSLQQPWANLIADGSKTIETRTWGTSYRGELVIVSSMKPAIEPAGCAVCICRLVDCRPMTVEDEVAACCDCDDGRWAWVLTDIRPVVPVPVKGQLQLYRRALTLIPKTKKGGQLAL